MYTDEEIESVVAQLVQADVSRPYDTLGIRRTDITWGVVQLNAASVFILYPAAPFFITYLAAQQLTETSKQVGETCRELLGALATLRRRMIPVRDLSSLSNAHAALVELETTLTKDITSTPAFSRFNNNIGRFLSKYGTNIRANGAIVRTPEESRDLVPSLVSDLLNQLATLREGILNLVGSLDDFNSLNLSQRVVGSIVNRAREMLSSRIESLNLLSETQRLEVLRTTVLELLASKSTILQYGAFLGPRDPTLSGTLTPYADGEHPALPARVSFKNGPYLLCSNVLEEAASNLLFLSLNESTTIKFQGAVTSSNSTPNTLFTRVSGSFSSDGVLPGDLVFVSLGVGFGILRRVTTVTPLVLTCEGPDLVAGACTIQVIKQPTLLTLPPSVYAQINGVLSEPFILSTSNNKLQFVVDGGSPVSITLTTGTRTASQVAADITAGLTGTGYKCQTALLPLTYDGTVTTAGNTLTLPYNLPGFINIGDVVDFYFGPNSIQSRTITGLTSNTITVNGAVLTTTTQDRIRVGSPQRVLQIVPTDIPTAVTLHSTIHVKTPTVIEQQTGITLGIFGEQLSKSKTTDASTLVDFINGNTSAISAELGYDSQGDVLARTDPSNNTRLELFLRTLTIDVPSGTSVTATVPSGHGLTLGDRVAVRSGVNLRRYGDVSAVTDTTATITFNAAVTAENDIIVDVVPTTAISRGMVVRVSSGPNSGSYVVSSVDTVPSDVFLYDFLAIVRTGTTPLVLSATVGFEYVILESTDKTLASKMVLFNPLLNFALTRFSTAVGNTPYFTFSKKGPVEAGDSLELYTTNTTIPDSVTTIDSYTYPLATLGTSYPVNVSYTLGAQIQPPPSAYVRAHRKYDFDTFKARLNTLLTTSPLQNLHGYLLELNAVVNPLLKNKNPTDVDCGTAENEVRKLYKYIERAGAVAVAFDTEKTFEAIVSSYVVPKVPQVDALIRAFRDQGAYRAVDTLLSCQFSKFFGLTQTETTYGGNLQERLRDIARLDLPVRKDQTIPVATSTNSPDFEIDGGDLD